MAAETQPRSVCRQPTHSAAWEGTGPGRALPAAPPPQKALQGVGLRVSPLGGDEHFRGGQQSPKNLV